MRLTQKIGKLFHPDGYRSAWAGMRRMAFPLRTGEFVAKLDREGLERIRAKYDVPGEKVKAAKYLDIAEWMPTNVKRVRDIQIRRAPPALRFKPWRKSFASFPASSSASRSPTRGSTTLLAGRCSRISR